ncbi:hypothetical protein VTO42DRAFT_8897 [Malbranchea cinnamomea]
MKPQLSFYVGVSFGLPDQTGALPMSRSGREKAAPRAVTSWRWKGADLGNGEWSWRTPPSSWASCPLTAKGEPGLFRKKKSRILSFAHWLLMMGMTGWLEDGILCIPGSHELAMRCSVSSRNQILMAQEASDGLKLQYKVKDARGSQRWKTSVENNQYSRESYQTGFDKTNTVPETASRN